MTPRALGWRPDVPDSRDRPSSLLLSATPVPIESVNSRLIKSVLDQGPTSSCVANFAMQAARGSHIQQGAINPPLGSRLFAYHAARKSHGGETEDAGTYLRSCLSAMAKLGFPPESAWPFDHSRVNTPPPFEAVHAAYDQRKPTEYVRIYETGSARVDQIKRALAAGYLVGFGTDIDASFFDVRDATPQGPPKGEIVGGHAMCCVDHGGDNIRVVNSWGTSWGDGGFFRMTADWLAHDMVRDLWIVKSAPRFSEAP